MTTTIPQNILAEAKNAVATNSFGAVRKAPAYDPALVQKDLAAHAADALAEVNYYTGSHATFNGKEDHSITVAGSRDAMAAIRAMIGKVAEITPVAARSSGQGFGGRG